MKRLSQRNPALLRAGGTRSGIDGLFRLGRGGGGIVKTNTHN